MRRVHIQQKGMSLVEMLVALAIFVIIGLAATNSISSFYRHNAYTIAQANQVNHAQRGVEFLVRDIREMTYSDDGAFPLVTKGVHSIGFYSDIDRDDSVEYVEYNLASTTLEKNIYDAVGFPPVYSTSSPSQTLIISEYVQNLNQGQDTFTYYDMNGALATPSTPVTDIRYVNVNLIINIDPIRDPGQFMLKSSASLRNLKDDI